MSVRPSYNDEPARLHTYHMACDGTVPVCERCGEVGTRVMWTGDAAQYRIGHPTTECTDERVARLTPKDVPAWRIANGFD